MRATVSAHIFQHIFHRLLLIDKLTSTPRHPPGYPRNDILSTALRIRDWSMTNIYLPSKVAVVHVSHVEALSGERVRLHVHLRTRYLHTNMSYPSIIFTSIIPCSWYSTTEERYYWKGMGVHLFHDIPIKDPLTKGSVPYS